MSKFCHAMIAWSVLGLATFGAVQQCRALAYSTTTQPFSGVTYTHRVQTVPRELSIHILEIDLTDPQLSFLVTPSNGSASLESTIRTTPSFVNSVGAQAGINASFYIVSGSNATNRGLVASQGDVYSPFGENSDYSRPWPTLNISADNIAQIVSRDFSQPNGSATIPSIPLYNAVSGSERIVTNGVVTAGAVSYGEPTLLHPRTVAGITADRKLVLMVVDGRQSGFSEGMTSFETANLLIQYGVTDAINLDGGGSSTMVLRPGSSSQVLNSPSDGSPRSVGTNLALFAGPSTQPRDSIVFADFYAGDRSTFSLSPTYSGSTEGVLSSSSSQVIQSDQAFQRGWYQRLTIKDDAGDANGWLVRHVSGSSASKSQNISRATSGYVGFWARTSTAGVETAIAIDDINNVTSDRSVRQSLIADGQWHLYEWNLEDDSQWEGWVDGDGHIIPNSTFTLDSLQFFGPNADAIIDLDMISHNALGSLTGLIPEPAAAMLWCVLWLIVPARTRRNPA